MILANAPQIARLFGHPRRWASRRVKAGRYGLATRIHGKSHWVPLAAVEQAEGVTFTAERLAAAGVHIPQQPEA